MFAQVILVVSILSISDMENTLHYFFSALFQGFAAIIALGSMFYLYFLQHFNSQKSNIESELKRQYNQERGILNEIYIKGIIEYCREELSRNEKDKINLRLNTMRELIQKHDTLCNFYDNVKNLIPKILNTTLIILILSLVSLFLVGYSWVLNYILLILGIILIGLSIYNLINVKNIIIKILSQKL